MMMVLLEEHEAVVGKIGGVVTEQIVALQGIGLSMVEVLRCLDDSDLDGARETIEYTLDWIRRAVPDDSTAIAAPPRTTRSRVGNGTALWIDKVDGRSAEYRRFKDAYGDFILHLGGDEATEPQRYLARRAAALVVWCEKAETALALGEDMNIVTYATATNSLRRLLADLGLERRAKDITGLASYLDGSINDRS
jgi:hypothetical protein